MDDKASPPPPPRGRRRRLRRRAPRPRRARGFTSPRRRSGSEASRRRRRRRREDPRRRTRRRPRGPSTRRSPAADPLARGRGGVRVGVRVRVHRSRSLRVASSPRPPRACRASLVLALRRLLDLSHLLLDLRVHLRLRVRPRRPREILLDPDASEERSSTSGGSRPRRDAGGLRGLLRGAPPLARASLGGSADSSSRMTGASGSMTPYADMGLRASASIWVHRGRRGGPSRRRRRGRRGRPARGRGERSRARRAPRCAPPRPRRARDEQRGPRDARDGRAARRDAARARGSRGSEREPNALAVGRDDAARRAARRRPGVVLEEGASSPPRSRRATPSEEGAPDGEATAGSRVTPIRARGGGYTANPRSFDDLSQ